ncbi:MAG: hypothetical protein H8D47_01455 [Planctomycetes bacterium]|nr:hypothetical protein [Planctomycetota bacterium]
MKNFRKKANIAIMVVAGMILIVAAVLKIHQLLAEPIISKTFWESWFFFVMQIPLEIGLGIWLLCGLFRKAGWLLAVSGYTVFIAATAHKVLIGAASCGCFGTVEVNPWITLFAIDVPVVIGLLVFRPVGCKLLPPPWPSAKHFFGVAIPTFILLPAIVGLLVFNRPPDKTDKYEVLRPEQWITEPQPVKSPSVIEPNIAENSQQGVITPNDTAAIEVITPQPSSPIKPEVVEQPLWPMLEYIDIADQLTDGIQIVLLYHYDCPNCQEAIPVYDQLARDMGTDQGLRFVFIYVPPFAPDGHDIAPDDTPALTGKMSDEKKWIFETPLVVLLIDGVVVETWQGDAPDFDTIMEAAFGE